MRPREFKECAPVYTEECDTEYEQHCKVITVMMMTMIVMMMVLGHQEVCHDLPDPVSLQQCLHPDMSTGVSAIHDLHSLRRPISHTSGASPDVLPGDSLSQDSTHQVLPDEDSEVYKGI